MLSLSRGNAFQEDTAGASRAKLTLTVVGLERTLDIALEIPMSSYPKELDTVRVSSDMWN